MTKKTSVRKSRKSTKQVKTTSRAKSAKSAVKTQPVKDDKKIVFVAEQPRREGTKAFKLYAEMKKFVGKRKVPVSEVFENTNYRRVDLNWDVKRGYVKVA